MNESNHPEDPETTASDRHDAVDETSSEPSDTSSVRPDEDVERWDDESTGDEALDARLSEPVFEGYRGIETVQVWMSGFLVAVVGLLAYSNSLGGSFVGLDRYLIQENVQLHRFSALPSAVLPGGPGPLAVGTLSLNWLATPDSATGFQVVNILLHLLNAVLLYLVARTMLRPRASEAVCMLAGLLFAVLPLATESVDYFVARGALLATFFSLLALLFAFRATRDADRLGAGAMGMSVLCHVLAAASEPAAVVLPLVTAAYVWLVRGTAGWRRWGVWALGLIGLMVAMVTAYTTGVDRIPGRLSALPSILVHSLAEATVPYGLSISHGVPWFSYVATFLVLVFSGSLIVALLVLRRRPGLPLLWFVAFSLGVSWTTSPGEMFSGHNSYLPVAGLLLLVPWLVLRLPAGTARVACGIGMAALVLVGGWVTLERNGVWKNPIALWSEASDLYPDAFEPKHELGRLYLQEGDDYLVAANQYGLSGQADARSDAQAEAMARFAAASEFLGDAAALGDPHVEVYLALAEAKRRQGDEAGAREALLDALSHDSTQEDATLQLASLWENLANQSGSREDALRALAYYERAHALNPLSPDRLARFGMLLASVGRFEDAEAALREAVGGRENSPYAGALNDVHGTVSQLQELETRGASLMRENRNDADGLRSLARARLIRGRYLDASYILERVLTSHPQDFGSWLYLGLARAKMDSAKQFIGEHGDAPADSESGVSPWKDLAERTAALNAWESAELYLARDTSLTPLARAVQLSEWAVAQRNVTRATAYIDQAKALDPESALPWLDAADLALMQGQRDVAETALAEAAARGAEDASLDARRERLKGLPAAPSPSGGG